MKFRLTFPNKWVLLQNTKLFWNLNWQLSLTCELTCIQKVLCRNGFCIVLCMELAWVCVVFVPFPFWTFSIKLVGVEDSHFTWSKPTTGIWNEVKSWKNLNTACYLSMLLKWNKLFPNAPAQMSFNGRDWYY